MKKVLKNNFWFVPKLISIRVLYFLLIASLLLLTGCRDSDFTLFQKEAVVFASNDKKIDEKEYNALVERIKASNDAGFKQFIGENKEINNPKLAEYLLKYFTAKKLTLNAGDIWQPNQTATSNTKFNVDVYIENSASMDGYVKGVTEFETAIYKSASRCVVMYSRTARK